MNAESRRILIIDDERPILLTLEALLGRQQFLAIVARIGGKIGQARLHAVDAGLDHAG